DRPLLNLQHLHRHLQFCGAARVAFLDDVGADHRQHAHLGDDLGVLLLLLELALERLRVDRGRRRRPRHPPERQPPPPRRQRPRPAAGPDPHLRTHRRPPPSSLPRDNPFAPHSLWIRHRRGGAARAPHLFFYPPDRIFPTLVAFATTSDAGRRHALRAVRRV